MKIAATRAEAFVRNPGDDIRAVLVYGPDAGLVRERAARLAASVVDDPADPFRVAVLAAADLRADPARLADETAAMSMTGGRRVVRLTEAGDGTAGPLRDILDGAPGDALVIAEAGPLMARSTLRRLFEQADNAAAIACYADDEAHVAALARETLAAQGLSLTADAQAYLVDNLGGDRMLTRRELEKLVIYLGPGPDSTPETVAAREVTLEDVAACVGDSAALGLDDAVWAAADGDYATVDRVVSRLYLEGASPVTILRAAARHFQRLHLAAARVDGGEAPERALAALRPPVYFKVKARVQAQLRAWPRAAIAAALERLTEAEIQCKTTGWPDRAICSRTLMALANVAARRRG